MIVWGGVSSNGYENTGARYNPTSDTWTALPTTGAPSARQNHRAVWTGSEMLIWGGQDATGSLNSGGRYNPSANTWSNITTTAAPAARHNHATVWSGTHMIIWAGFGTDDLDTGSRYSPVSNNWFATSTTGVPAARTSPTAIWTGSLMIVWGGFGTLGGFENSGGRYSPVANTWQITTTNAATVPAERNSHTAIWTGTEMIVWGGIGNESTNFNSGGRYNPTTDTWVATPINGAPENRYSHTAVWTGTEMIVWGGYDNSVLNSGGRYKTATSTWTNTALVGAPSPRYYHTAVWTGTEMIVWGGYDAGNYLGNGRRYNPVTDTWISIGNLPPTVSLTGPTNGATSIAPVTFFLMATAADADGSVTKVDFYNGTNLLGTDFTSGYDFTWTNVQPGGYSLTARATDNGGVVSTSSVVNITVNSNDVPVVTLTAPANNAIFTPPGSVPLSATASDSQGIARVDFFAGSSYLGTATSSPYNLMWTGAPSGVYNLTARATDSLGLSKTSAPVALIVDALPTVAIVYPANNGYVPRDLVTLKVNANDSDGSVSQVQYYLNGGFLGSSTLAPFDLSWNNPAIGTYSLSAIATDNLGLSRTSNPVNVVVALRPGVQASMVSNQCLLTVTGEVSRVYRTLASSDFLNWVAISTNSTTNSVFSIVDTNFSSMNHRFYRATPEP